jgi:hypothetical protein
MVLGLVALFIGACNCVFSENELEYMFEADDPDALVPVSFPAAELPPRLDASGHRHGGSGFGTPPDVQVVSLDNGCMEAWFRTEPGTTPMLRIIGLESTGRCAESREELVRVFKEGFVPRLEGLQPPMPYADDIEGEFFQYPAGAAPVLTLSGSLDEARQRFDDAVLFQHEFHDGVYYLGVCSGQFRVSEDPTANSVRIEGVGYAKPCDFGDDQACLTRAFTFALQPSSMPTPLPTGTHCPFFDDE